MRTRAAAVRVATWLAATLSVAIVSGCSLFFPAPEPMTTSWHRSQGADPERPLLILLPGRGSGASDLVEQGFVDAVVRSGKADVVAVNATQGYYMRRTLIPRLLEDVIRPAQQAGYRRLWLVGISMGGLGALLTSEKHVGVIEGVLLMAPFLGDEDVIDEISLQGGLTSWTPPTPPDMQKDYQRALWSWLKGYTKPEQQQLPKLYLGFGREDRFARSNELLAAVLPASHVFRVAGDHDWGPWREVFNLFVQSDALGSTSTGAAAGQVQSARSDVIALMD